MAKQKRTRRAWGTIRKKRGRWTVEYTGPDGAIHTPGCSFAYKSDAEGWLAQERRLIDLEAWTPPKQRKVKEEQESITVGQWLVQFHELLGQPPNPLKESTMQHYVEVTRTRIMEPLNGGANNDNITRLKDIRLCDLTKGDVYRWWDNLQREYPDSETRNHQAYKRLRAACAEAVKREMIPVNPVDIPSAGHKPQPKEKYLPTDSEIQRILETVPARYRALTSLVLHHGLRLGEALALELRHVTVRGGKVPELPQITIHVEQNAQRLKRGGKTTMVLQESPKTRAGRREVPIMLCDIPLFIRHLAHFVPLGHVEVAAGDGSRRVRLFTATRNGQMVLDTSYRSVLERAVAEAGVNPAIKPHNGRNWLITRLAENGAHLKEIGKLLGQDDMETITAVYMKVRAGRTDVLMRKVSEGLEVG